MASTSLFVWIHFLAVDGSKDALFPSEMIDLIALDAVIVVGTLLRIPVTDIEAAFGLVALVSL